MNNKHKLICLSFIAFYALCCINGCKTTETNPGKNRTSFKENPLAFPVIDTHTHLSPDKNGNFYSGAQTALSMMKKLGIEKSFVMPYPFTPGQHGLFTIDDPSFIRTVQRHKGTLFFLGGGGTLNVMIQETVRAGDVSEKLKKHFKEQALKILEKGAIGFGELGAEHVSMRSGHPYLSAPPDHALFLLLADIAAENGVPIDLHMEAVPVDMPLPEGLSSPPNPKILTANIPALERLLAHNRKANIIWAHAGWDNTGYRTPSVMAKLFERHPNLYMSLKTNKRDRSENSPIRKGGRVTREWIDLITKYADRFLVGSDLKYGQPRLAKTGVMAILRQLPPNVLKKVAYENAVRIFKLS